MSIEPLFHKNLPARERFLLEGYNVEIYGVLFFINKTISGAERILWIQYFLKFEMCTGRKYKLYLAVPHKTKNAFNIRTNLNYFYQGPGQRW